MYVVSCSLHVPSDDEAQRCIKHLADKFGDSPRVEILSGIRIEATENSDVALQYYNKLLENDPTSSVSATRLVTCPSTSTKRNEQAVWRRKAYTLRNMGKIDKSVEELTTLLDTFYNEVDGWVELAEIYYLCNQYSLHPRNLLSGLTYLPGTIMHYRHSHTRCS